MIFKHTTKLILSFALLTFALNAKTFAKEEESNFLAPRDNDIFYVSGISSPFRSSYQRRKLNKECNEDLASYHFCNYILKIDENEFREDFALEDLINNNTQLLFFGEMHLDQFPKDYIFSNLTLLNQDLGYTTLALEMFNTKSQKVIDRFLKNKISARSLEKELKKYWGYNTNYMTLIRGAKKRGMSIIALDDRPKYKRLELSENIKMRDLHWARVLIKYFKERPVEKVIVLAGKMHAFETFAKEDIEIKTVGEQVERYTGVKSQSIHLSSRSNLSYFDKIYDGERTNKKIVLYQGEELSPYITGSIFQF